MTTKDGTTKDGTMKGRDFGRVVVVFGGHSAEREVSLNSGAAVLAGLQRSGVDAVGYDFAEGGMAGLEALKPDIVFIALHGRGGEDGCLQGALELAGIPYTGSGVMASALGMDKLRTKALWQAAGLPTPESIEMTAATDRAELIERLGLPMIIKPVHEGSTIGITIVRHPDELEKAWQDAAKYDARVMAERFVVGSEFTLSVLGDSALPAIKVEVPNGFYDYEAKYLSNDTLYHLPCGLEPEEEAQLAELSLSAFAAVGCSGWGRVDVMRDAEGRFWLLEVNTVPGMTDHSLVPQAAAHAGIDFDELVVRILADVKERN